MITHIKHKGLRLLYEKGDRSKIRGDMLEKTERALSMLDIIVKPEDMNLPGFGLHALKGDMQGLWSISVSRNHRIVFRCEEGDVFDVDLCDYH